MTNKKNPFNETFEEYRESLGDKVNEWTFQDFVLWYEKYLKEKQD